MTPDELRSIGYSDTDIQTMIASVEDTPTSGISSNFIGPAAPAPTGSSSLGSTISTLGTTFVNLFRAFNPPAAGTKLINPATGLPYTQAQLAGTTSGLSGLFPIVLIVLAIWFFSRAGR